MNLGEDRISLLVPLELLGIDGLTVTVVGRPRNL